jgi:hypothetical protein
MKNALVAAGGAALIIASYAASSSATEGPTLDLTGIRNVKITGEASWINITTDSARPLIAQLGAVRHRTLFHWTSGWFGNDCTVASRMHVEDGTLFVDAVDSSWFGFSDCAPTIALNLEEGASLSIQQHAADVRINGQLSDVSFNGHAADIKFDGHARTVALSADAMKATLTFDQPEKTESVELTSDALDATVELGPGVPVDYRIDAKASMVDTQKVSTPGALPRVRVTGKFVRFSLR